MPSNPPDAPNTGINRQERKEFNDANRPFARKVKVVPVSDSGELRELLDALVDKSVRLECCDCESMPCDHADEYQASRRSVLDLFERLQKENERLRTVYSVCPECNTSWTNGEVETEANRLRAENQQLREQLDEKIRAWMRSETRIIDLESSR